VAGFNYVALLLELPDQRRSAGELLARARAIEVAPLVGSPDVEGLTADYPRRDKALAALMIGRLACERTASWPRGRGLSGPRWLDRALRCLRAAETVYLQPLGYIARGPAAVRQQTARAAEPIGSAACQCAAATPSDRTGWSGRRVASNGNARPPLECGPCRASAL
jgi:hypothetical protein